MVVLTQEGQAFEQPLPTQSIPLVAVGNDVKAEEGMTNACFENQKQPRGRKVPDLFACVAPHGISGFYSLAAAAAMRMHMPI